ncbi:hypothetical protein BAY61_00680 [Prauserella marina]|uniref:Uncharacterized conserved protein, DUF427 family n=1 Tax=Prauserella marina TaxID=530584 RepID=A0A222VJ14_9PSEU|nr:DUF427 domain-containing protein [Prauserella marina]ASR33743.1 hypothetical protein BAY61_00680 [Prauserella marina]PWV82311.1 uncharacterized protein (DUF427 family) [Prauserella marina]SDC65992.1 Uncharacterized conserved protein, DUF427 family [Prauserella marina]
METETRGRVRVERGAKRVRAVFAGKVVADTTRPLLVWEVPYFPAYYFPREDVDSASLEPTGATRRSPSRGEGVLSTLKAGGKTAEDAATEYPDSPIAALRDHVRFEWDVMDAWFEEDEEVYTHPRDPHTRVDILPSSRNVRVEVGGVVVADSGNPRLLFETGLPTRYYLPKTDVRLDLLVRSDKVTHCPYKGSAEYWSVNTGGEVVADLAWSYRTPLPESERVAGLIAFTDELVDVYVDGALQERPKTKFA